MASRERRMTPRFRFNTPLTFHRIQISGEAEQRANAINISTRGVYFATSLVIAVGSALEVSLEVPRRVTGSKAINRRFAGRVIHVVSDGLPEGLSRIGVQFLYYEHDLVAMPMESFEAQAEGSIVLPAQKLAP